MVPKQPLRRSERARKNTVPIYYVRSKQLLKQPGWGSDATSGDSEDSTNKTQLRVSKPVENTRKAQEDIKRKELLQQLSWGIDMTSESDPRDNTNYKLPNGREGRKKFKKSLKDVEEDSVMTNDESLEGDNSEIGSLSGEHLDDGFEGELSGRDLDDESETYVRDDIDMKFVAADDEGSFKAWNDLYKDSTDDDDQSIDTESLLENPYSQDADLHVQSQDKSEKDDEENIAEDENEYGKGYPAQEQIHIGLATGQVIPEDFSTSSSENINVNKQRNSGVSFYQVVDSMEQQSEVQVEDILEAIQYSNTLRDVGRGPVVTNTFIVPTQTEGDSISLNALRQAYNEGIAQLVWASDVAEAYEIGIRQACPVGFEDEGTTNNAHWWVGLSQAHIELGPFATKKEIEARKKVIARRKNPRKRKTRDGSDDEGDGNYAPQ